MRKPTSTKFRLYIASDTPNSDKAMRNLRLLCNAYLVDRHEIEIVDVFAEPSRALEDHIMMTPTLIKYFPLPVVRVIGTLSDQDFVLQRLGLESDFS